MSSHRVSPRALKTAVVLAAAVLSARCATNPVTGERQFNLLSEAQELEIGQQMHGEVIKTMGEYGDPALREYVQRIGTQLASHSHRPNLPWQFTIVNAPAINAFALPGGYVYITRGILPYLDNEAELAGVLGHEIGHVTARHAAQAYTRATGGELALLGLGIFVPAARPFGQLGEMGLSVLFLKNSRNDELQADKLGAEYSAKNGWDPAGVEGLLNTLARVDTATDSRGVPNWLETHPQPADRVERVSATIAQLKTGPERYRVDRDEYLRRVDGVLYGDDPKEGIVRGSRFLHPDLQFAIEFPAGWDVTNGPTQVVAKQPDAEYYMVMQLVEDPRGRSVEEAARANMREAGFAEIQGGRETINGLDSYVGTYRGSVQSLGRVQAEVAHIAHNRKVYLVAGLAKENDFPQVRRLFERGFGSFHALSRREAEDIRPNRVDLYVARAGDTWQSIAQRAGEGIVKATTLAIMNNHAVNDQPRPGERLKIVVAG